MMIAGLTFILFFILALVLIWLWTRKQDSAKPFNATAKFNLPLNIGSALLGKTSLQTRIVFNGQEYSSPEEMPAEIREVYERTMANVLADNNRNNIPDIFETGSSATVFHTDVLARTLDDPAAKLRQLKEMKDANLITDEEYETKKADILNRM